MHIHAVHLALGVQLRPAAVLAAEKSKVPFYVAGGLLVLWALFVSLALGMRHPAFPRNLTGERVVIGITSVLVLAALATAVTTSSPPAKATSSPTAASSTGEAHAPPPPPPSPAGAPKPTTPASTEIPRARASTKLKLAANPTGLLSYNTKQLSARAGAVTIEMTNMSPLEHDVTVVQGSAVLGATPKFIGGTRSVTLNLKPGSYTFYCSVPGHRQAGMEGTLSVS
jgi:plastocyanin